MNPKPYLGGNLFDKYGSKNPLVKLAVWIYLKQLFALLRRCAFRQVLDIGGGEGHIANKISAAFAVPVVCLEPNRKFVQQHTGKYPRVSYLQGSAYHIPKNAKSIDLVLCLEVLEHLPEPAKAVAELRRVAKRWIIISVPNEPFFRISNMLRFKYLSRFGNTPDHVQAWTSGGFKRFIRRQAPNARFQNALLWNFALIKQR